LNIIIAGAGLTGLSCAFELQKSGINTTLIDFRQEIGSPTRSPGVIRDVEFFKSWLETFNLNPKCSYLENKENIAGIRREWLEKNLAIELGKFGNKILMKRKIGFVNMDTKGKVKLSTNIQSKRSKKEFDCNIVVDALGNKPQTKSWSCNSKILSEKSFLNNKNLISIPKLQSLTSWRGGLTSDSDTLIKFETEDDIIFQRGDGFFECWSKKNNFTDTNWIELIYGNHPPNPFDFSVDITIKKGIELAHLTKNRLSLT